MIRGHRGDMADRPCRNTWKSLQNSSNCEAIFGSRFHAMANVQHFGKLYRTDIQLTTSPGTPKKTMDSWKPQRWHRTNSGSENLKQWDAPPVVLCLVIPSQAGIALRAWKKLGGWGNLNLQRVKLDCKGSGQVGVMMLLRGFWLAL